MLETRAAGECFLHFSSVLKCAAAKQSDFFRVTNWCLLSCFISLFVVHMSLVYCLEKTSTQILLILWRRGYVTNQQTSLLKDDTLANLHYPLDIFIEDWEKRGTWYSTTFTGFTANKVCPSYTHLNLTASGLRTGSLFLKTPETFRAYFEGHPLYIFAMPRF